MILPSNRLDFGVPSLQVVVGPGSILYEHVPCRELNRFWAFCKAKVYAKCCKENLSTSIKVITLLDETRLDEMGVDNII